MCGAKNWILDLHDWLVRCCDPIADWILSSNFQIRRFRPFYLVSMHPWVWPDANTPKLYRPTSRAIRKLANNNLNIHNFQWADGLHQSVRSATNQWLIQTKPFATLFYLFDPNPVCWYAAPWPIWDQKWKCQHPQGMTQFPSCWYRSFANSSKVSL